MISSPAVSVVLSVRNGGTDLPKAIGTITAQTFSDFELIVINNGSTDQTGAFLDGIADPRVRVYHQKDAGLAAALNRGISLARGRYIARQDHDDWAAPSRIQKQVEFLDANPDYALVGTRAEIWIGDHPTGRFHDHPTEDELLRFELIFNNPFVHSSVMIRKSALDIVGGYTSDPARQPPEDYELWSRIARMFRVANLPERLTIYREVPGSMSRVGESPFVRKLVLISGENLAAASGLLQPKPIHFEIAALVHDPFYKVSSALNAADVCEIVTRAARNITSGRRSRDVDARVNQWCHHFKSKIRIGRVGLSGLQTIARRIRNCLRRLGVTRR